jgi:hypothetical protein
MSLWQRQEVQKVLRRVSVDERFVQFRHRRRLRPGEYEDVPIG